MIACVCGWWHHADQPCPVPEDQRIMADLDRHCGNCPDSCFTTPGPCPGFDGVIACVCGWWHTAGDCPTPADQSTMAGLDKVATERGNFLMCATDAVKNTDPPSPGSTEKTHLEDEPDTPLEGLELLCACTARPLPHSVAVCGGRLRWHLAPPCGHRRCKGYTTCRVARVLA